MGKGIHPDASMVPGGAECRSILDIAREMRTVRSLAIVGRGTVPTWYVIGMQYCQGGSKAFQLRPRSCMCHV